MSNDTKQGTAASPSRSSLHEANIVGAQSVIQELVRMEGIQSESDRVVICGMSARLPESDDVNEFWEHLIKSECMITSAGRRWKPGQFGLPPNQGTLRSLSKFDAEFFGIVPRMANQMDPQLRILHEVAYEAIIDAGFHPNELKGSNTGVYVGCTYLDSAEALCQETDPKDGYAGTGTHRAVLSNRLSYHFDLHGPSYTIDSACSSSLMAVHNALQDIKSGQCSSAIVGACNITVKPQVGLQFQRLGVLSKDGYCRPFDIEGDGFTRSEAVVVIYITKESLSRRAYGYLINTGTNNDGFKDGGLTYPSGQSQFQLMQRLYREANITPQEVELIETHGTATKAGDKEEISAITKCLGQYRSSDNPLLIGSTKSNMGHAEGAAGLASLVKVLLSFNKGIIPPNLYYNKPKPDLESLKDGLMKVVSKPTPYHGGFVGISSYGFSGANVHIITKGFRPSGNFLETTIPKLFIYEGRSQEAIEKKQVFLLNSVDNNAFYSLSNQVASGPINGMKYRGHNLAGDPPEISKVEQMNKRPIWFVFSGMGSQWPGMGKDLMLLDTFQKSILRCHKAVQNIDQGVDLLGVITNGTERILKDMTTTFVAITSIQVALVNCLKDIGIIPDGIIGHSLGEIAAGFADEGLTEEQAVLSSYWRGHCIAEGNLPPGCMASVGLPADELKIRLPPGVQIACYNSEDNVTISGDKEPLLKFVAVLEKEDVFVRKVETSDIAYHSHHVARLGPDIMKALQEVIQNPVPRSSSWISTSVRDSLSNLDVAKLCSPEYFANNLVSPVLFHDALQKVPVDAIVIEFAPHCLMQAILKRSLNDGCLCVGLKNRKEADNITYFLKSIGKIYSAGVNLNLNNLYPPLPYPVGVDTPPLSPSIKWDHSKDWHVPSLDDFLKSGSANPCVMSFTIDISPEGPDSFLQDHRIEDRILYPAAGFIVLVWKALAHMQNVPQEKLCVKFTDVTLDQAVILPTSGTVTLDVKILSASRTFEVNEGTQLISSGKYILPENPVYQVGSFPDKDINFTEVGKADIYKELRLLGYNYGEHFQGITKIRRKGSISYVQWKDNWVTFLDAVLQTIVVSRDNFGKDLLLPSRIGSICINPQHHLILLKAGGKTQINEFPVHVDKTMAAGTSGGVKVTGMQTTSSPSKKLPQNPTLEFVEFVPYGRFQLSLEKPEIMEYASLCKMYLTYVLKRISNFYQDKLSMKNYDDNKNDERLQLKVNEFLGSEGHGYLVAMRAIDQLIETDDLVEHLGRTIDEHLIELSGDKLLSNLLTNFSFKNLLDIVWENCSDKTMKVLELGGRFGGLFLHLVPASTVQPLLQLDLTVCDSHEDKLKEIYRDQIESFNVATAQFDLNTGYGKRFSNVHLVTVSGLNIQSKNVRLSLKIIFSMLADGGFLLLHEVTTTDNDFSRCGVFIRGIIEGNFPPEKHESHLTSKQWSDIIQDVGFDVIQEVTDGICSSMFLCRKKRQVIYAKDLFVPISTQNFNWIKDLKGAFLESKNGTNGRRIWITVNGEYNNGVVGLVNCLKQEPGGETLRCIFNASFAEKESEMTLDTATMKKLSETDLVMNVCKNGVWGSFRHQVLSQERCSIKTTTACLRVNTPGDLSSLKWVQLSLNRTQDALQQVPCTSQYSSLNFRDIMLATGKLSFDAVSGTRNCEFLGFEFSGFDSNGKRVMGIALNKALATHINAEPYLLFDVPDSWTLEDAATVPAVYATVYYALIVRGQLKRGESILIHSGSGGVGQAAIAVARSYQCKIFVTVGTPEKRKFLMEQFPFLNENSFASSRDLTFEDYIMHQTNGEGVNLVLNSLAEEKLEASVRCLSTGGKFLEIGKYDISINTKLGMSAFTGNVSFHGIALDALISKNNSDWTIVSDLIKNGIEEGVVKPLTRHVFNRENVETAFRYMAQGKHIGKVLIKMKQEKDDHNVSKMDAIYAAPRNTCHPDKVYIVVGGLGGFGLELSNWLVDRGCRKLVLTSRSGIKSGYQAKYTDDWREAGVQVQISKLDVGYQDEALRLIKQCLIIGSIGGIFNLALVLSDAEFESQTEQAFEEVCRPKLNATRNLDVASRELCGSELDWFVMFSSAGSGRGNAGQSNYGFANSCMERICEKRRADGLPGQAIQWGVIGDVGRVFDVTQNNHAIVAGTAAQSIQSCLSTIDIFLSQPHPVVSSFIKDEKDFKTQERNLRENLVQVVGKALGINDVDSINECSTLAELGVDSLLVVEIRQILERQHSISLKPQKIRQLTLRTLKDGFLDQREENRNAEKENRDKKETFVSSFLNLEETQCLVELKAGNKSNAPIFIIHPGEGTIDLYRPLVDTSYENPLYALQVTKDVPHDSLKNMATYYLSQISSVYPGGPIYLAGYSLGAAVAIEIAIQLQVKLKENLSVKKLVLIDGSHESVKNILDHFIITDDPPDMQFLIAYTQLYKQVTYEEMKKKLLCYSSYAEQLQETVSILLEDFPLMTRENLAFSIDSMRKRLNIAKSYVPMAELRGEVYLLKAAEGHHSSSQEYAKSLGLGKICVGNFFVKELEGDHHTIMQKPRISTTAEEVWNIINS